MLVKIIFFGRIEKWEYVNFEYFGCGCSYRAFDEYDGIEVAWNQVKLHNFMQSPEDLERLYCEIHLLKTLHHKNIMKISTLLGLMLKIGISIL